LPKTPQSGAFLTQDEGVPKRYRHLCISRTATVDSVFIEESSADPYFQYYRLIKARYGFYIKPGNVVYKFR